VGLIALAVAWGFAEATLFFLVPDILLSFAILKFPGRALQTCFAALGGALVGGSLMYAWGHADADGALRVLDYIPAISPGMLQKVASELATDGWSAMLFGPLAGIPYKIYAVESGAQSIGLWIFLLASVPARLFRFLAVTYAAYALSGLLMRKASLDKRWFVLAAVWCLFYLFYFSVMPN
jgi:membrane protein YqaA with SNARE-associated domain